ncbi:RNA polymerase sigma factor [Spirillospora sp. CA-294931]|uniref:RNA polymerase sigma factor n=1 Tax=Spirillospora sp. CA-294931 TaxID=3240042 RepID=UPI003D93837B
MEVDVLPVQEPPDATTAVTDLYRGRALGLMRLALMMVGDRPTAEDVVQDAFTGLYRRCPRLRDREKALTYVRSSVLNGCRAALRRRRRPFTVKSTKSRALAALGRILEEEQ